MHLPSFQFASFSSHLNQTFHFSWTWSNHELTNTWQKIAHRFNGKWQSWITCRFELLPPECVCQIRGLLLLEEGGRLETSYSNTRKRNDCRDSPPKLKPKGGDAILSLHLIWFYWIIRMWMACERLCRTCCAWRIYKHTFSLKLCSLNI